MAENKLSVHVLGWLAFADLPTLEQPPVVSYIEATSHILSQVKKKGQG